MIAESISGFLEPLAGILSGLEWMRVNRPDLQWLATFACDYPFFPRDMVQQLLQRAETERASVAVAASGNRNHPVFAIWNTKLPVTSEGVLGGQGSRKMADFVARFPNTRVIFPSEPVDPFFNLNTPADLARAEGLLLGGDA
jgi:molybdopterin-guanine dinucleotide biosynthesis protein A